MGANSEPVRGSSVLAGFIAAAVIVASMNAGIEAAADDLKSAAAVVSDAAKVAARGARWLAIHYGSTGGERASPPPIEARSTEIRVVVRPAKPVCPRPKRTCGRVFIQRTLQ